MFFRLDVILATRIRLTSCHEMRAKLATLLAADDRGLPRLPPTLAMWSIVAGYSLTPMLVIQVGRAVIVLAKRSR